MESKPKESQNTIIENNNKQKSEEIKENKILEEEMNIEEIQKKLEEQGEVNSNENDLFSNKLDCMLENIACIIATEKYLIIIHNIYYIGTN